MKLRTRDEILDPPPAAKTLVLGAVWTGTLAPKVDALLAAVEPFRRGFVTGHIVSAEKGPSTADLGRVWAGALDAANALSRAARDAQGVNLSEVQRQIELLQQQIGSNPIDFPGVVATADRLRRAADTASVHASVAASRSSTADSARASLVASRARTRSALVAIRTQVARYWAGDRDRTPVDPNGAVRDATHTALSADHMRDRIRAIAAGHSAFWAGRR